MNGLNTGGYVLLVCVSVFGTLRGLLQTHTVGR